MGEATDRLQTKLTRIPVVGYERVEDGSVQHVDAHFRELDLRNPMRGQNYTSAIENRVPGMRANHPRVLSPLIHARTVDALMEQSNLLRGTDLGEAFEDLADVLDTSSPVAMRSVADTFVRVARRAGRGDLARWASIAHRIADQLEGKRKLSREDFDAEMVQLTASLQSGHEPGSAVERLHVHLAAKEFTKSQREKAPTAYENDDNGGSFPINNVSDLKNAIRAIGRAKDPAKAKAHIKARAKALNAEKLIPDDWS